MSRSIEIIKARSLIFLLCVSCVIFYSCFLSIEKGYIYGSIILLFVVVGSFLKLKRLGLNSDVKVIFLFLLIFPFFMGHSFESLFLFSNKGDYLTKYLIGAFALVGAACVTLPPKVFVYSLVLGCFTSAALAVYQFPIMGRADGFTNAIRFGNIAMLMGVFCWIFIFVKQFGAAEKVILFIGGMAGVVASVLSLSRGGWLILLVLPFVVIFFARTQQERKKMYLGGLAALAALLILVSVVPVAQQRFVQAQNEVVGYFENPQKYAMTSVGARLEQWRLSWKLGWDKPLTGWGVESIEIGRKTYMERGEAHAYMDHIHHSHNEFLEMWATRGILGVLALCVFYLLPSWVFWPSKKKVEMFSPENRSLYIGLSATGLMLSVSYFVFGLTDVFFNLAIGHNFFVFTLVFLMSSIQWLKKNDAFYTAFNK